VTVTDMTPHTRITHAGVRTQAITAPFDDFVSARSALSMDSESEMQDAMERAASEVQNPGTP